MLWEAWRLSQTYQGYRPSQQLQVVNPIAAYFLDKAVFRFGLMIDGEIERAGQEAKTDKAAEVKRNMVLNKWRVSEGTRQFRDPANRAR